MLTLMRPWVFECPFITVYFPQILDWARKYGLRVYLDLHAMPGSQNGYGYSGRLSPVNFHAGNMGLAHAQRILYYMARPTAADCSSPV
ncbi:hypothetical protein BDQ12DRAFT_400273 [Crucibulum laeve]|uniref:Glycoside hydrolase superfamily n=1 Tax=Crucibulum laeve TaxID=68775 RepID=A0A5C3LMG0_9AGAR|nr:hypothetical protein BDQ12DRAFT_400273 [Crucibulum laeve]